MRPTIAAEIPLVGRSAELGQIVTQLSSAYPAAFVVAGTAGVGKSRLAAEAAKALAGFGQTTVHVVATRSAASIPFGPFAPLLSMSDLGSDSLLGLLNKATQAIAERAGGNPLLLVVDDAQLLDDGSAALVHQLVHEAVCSVIVSIRIPAAAPDPITALWKDGLAVRIDLDPLTELEVAEVAASLLGGPVSGAAVRRIWDVSEGNALFVREMLIGAAESGALANDGGMWVLRRPLTASDRLVELVASRLEGLAQDTIGVIELLAAGEPLSLELLESLTVHHAVEDAERQGFVGIDLQGRVPEARLAHPIYGEVLRQRLPKSRLRWLWTSLAECMEANGAPSSEDVLRLARWQLDAGGPVNPSLLNRAARQASQLFDLELAARLARAAFDSEGGVDAGIALGEAEFRSGNHEEAERILAGIVAICATDTELAKVANARSYNLGVLIGNPAAANQVLEDALVEITDANARLRLLSRMAINLIFEGKAEAVLDVTAELISSDNDSVISRGTYAASIAWALLGRGDEAVNLARRGMEAHQRADESNQLPEVQLVGAVLGHTANGRLAQALSDATEGYRVFLAAGDREGQATFSMLRGLVNVELGQLAAATRDFMEGASINRELRDTGALRWCLGGLALAEGMAGHRELADAAVTELDRLPSSWIEFLESDLIDRGRAWACVAAGEVSRARDALQQAGTRAATAHHWAAEGRLLHDIARLGDPASVTTRLAELEGMVDVGLMSVFSANAAALADQSPDKLAASAEGFERLGAQLLGAESWSVASEHFRSLGYARRASAADTRVKELTRLCGEVRTPGFASHGEERHLTRREREVAGLAATGVSSRDIAAKLFISSRTVDSHLQSVYNKLGITNREDLRRAIGDS
jgi:DNA-binding CsgD family transcriptional regulator